MALDVRKCVWASSYSDDLLILMIFVNASANSCFLSISLKAYPY